MSFVYNIEDHSLFKAAFTIRHTLWPYVFRSFGFWFFLVVHLALWYSYRHKLLRTYGPQYGVYLQFGEGFLETHLSDLKVMSGICTFFIVFYTQQCYTKYMEMNRCVNQVFRSTHRFGFHLKVMTYSFRPGKGQNYLRLASRFVYAELVAFFIVVRQGDLRDENWNQLRETGLLLAEEVDILKGYNGGQHGLVLLDWAVRVALEGQHEAQPDNVNYQGQQSKAIVDRILEIHEAQGQILDLHRMPVPFQYFHMLNIMIFMCVGSWSYYMAMTDSVFGPISFFLSSFIFLGMLELAKLFSNPFGDDEVDFPIHVWCSIFLENQAAYLEEQYDTSSKFFMEKVDQQGPLRLTHDELAATIVGKDFRERQPVRVSQTFTGFEYQAVPSHDCPELDVNTHISLVDMGRPAATKN